MPHVNFQPLVNHFTGQKTLIHAGASAMSKIKHLAVDTVHTVIDDGLDNTMANAVDALVETYGGNALSAKIVGAGLKAVGRFGRDASRKVLTQYRNKALDWVTSGVVNKKLKKKGQHGWQIKASHTIDAATQGVHEESRDMPYRRGYGKSYGRGRRYTTRSKAGNRRRFGARRSYRPGRRTAYQTVPRQAYPGGLQRNWYDVFNCGEGAGFTVATAAQSVNAVAPCFGATEPTLQSFFSGIVQGTAVNQRQGQRIVCNSIFIDMNFRRPEAGRHEIDANADAVGTQVVLDARLVGAEDYIHVILVKDTQCNGTAKPLNEIFDADGFVTHSTDAIGDVAMWLREMNHVLQYKIVSHQKIKWPARADVAATVISVPTNPTGNTMSTVAGSNNSIRAQISVKCNEIVNYAATNGAVVADVLDNNVMMFVMTERTRNSSQFNITCDYAYRVRFQTLC